MWLAPPHHPVGVHVHFLFLCTHGSTTPGHPQVDTHIHHSACMHQKHLLRFIKSKLRKEPDEVVIFRDGKYLTLKEVGDVMLNV